MEIKDEILLSVEVDGNAITRYYNLDGIDIESFDKHKMIYDDGYYIVLKISDHKSGQQTKVDVLRVN